MTQPRHHSRDHGADRAPVVIIRHTRRRSRDEAWEFIERLKASQVAPDTGGLDDAET